VLLRRYRSESFCQPLIIPAGGSFIRLRMRRARKLCLRLGGGTLLVPAESEIKGSPILD
jgi:hypothetical protein